VIETTGFFWQRTYILIESRRGVQFGVGGAKWAQVAFSPVIFRPNHKFRCNY